MGTKVPVDLDGVVVALCMKCLVLFLVSVLPPQVVGLKTGCDLQC